jgi:hypothetical protein
MKAHSRDSADTIARAAVIGNASANVSAMRTAFDARKG